MNEILKKYSHRYGSTYLTGVIMGVNAIKDIALFIDGPDCNFYKSDTLYKTHDLNSTLKDPSINTRIYFSGVMPNKMVNGYDSTILRKLEFISNNDNFEVAILSYMPVTSLLGIQYNNIYSDIDKQFILVPSYTDKYWVDGYSIFLKELAKNIDLQEKEIDKDLSISLIGFLFDRNEGDCIGNIEEIKRILSVLGIKLDSTWLSGGNYSELKEVVSSELLVSLPYGKYAVKTLSRRLGTEYIETNIPLGLKNTIKFVRDIASKLGIDREVVEDFLSKEIENVLKKIDILDKDRFLNKNFVFAGDPNIEDSIIDICSMLGMNHIKSYYNTGDLWPLKEDFDTEVDVVIGNSEFEIIGLKYLKYEFGFPSYSKHYLSNRPFMGFNGLLNFIEGLYFESSLLDENKYQEMTNYAKSYYF